MPLYLSEYSFIEDIPISKGKGKGKGNYVPPPPPPSLIHPKPLTKYDKMIKMGVPTNAVQHKKILDNKICASDLQNVTLKKTTQTMQKKMLLMTFHI